jgi:cation diffusion facilitator family transporter
MSHGHSHTHRLRKDSKLAWILWVSLTINAGMFVIEFGAGTFSGSSSLIADSLDMLADSFIYGGSLFVLAGTLRQKKAVSFLKGVLMFGLGTFALYGAVSNIALMSLPVHETMTSIGALALVANVICALLLMRYRSADINIRSAWLCSRNDALSNLSVVVAGVLVAVFGSHWPDSLVGIAISLLVLWSAAAIIRESLAHGTRH